LSTNPRVLLLDEPTVGVDIGAKVELLDFVNEVTVNGNTAIFVSSELAEICAICNRVLILHNGEIVEEIKHSDTYSEEVLQHAIQPK